ncbi:hypothetical protein ACVWWO_006389 [Bradyrhizobium sp. F1.13.1]
MPATKIYLDNAQALPSTRRRRRQWRFGQLPQRRRWPNLDRHERRYTRFTVLAKLLAPPEQLLYMKASTSETPAPARAMQQQALPFSFGDHRRRRSTDVITAAREIVIALLLRLGVASCRLVGPSMRYESADASAGQNCVRMYYQVAAFAEGLFAGNPAAVLVP